MRAGDLLGEINAFLTEHETDQASLDARLLVTLLCELDMTALIAHPETEIAPTREDAVRQAARRRAAGEPLHRILGFREFRGLRLGLSPDTLEPRPDTETLVDLVLPYLLEVATKGGFPRILDLGTGTGAVALALLKEVPEATALGVDISQGALKTAMANAEQLGLSERFDVLQSSWFDAVAGQFHFIVSNPPYVRSGDIAGLKMDVRDHDPLAALDGGADGLAAFRPIAEGAGKHLMDGGMIAVEIGSDQREDVISVFGAAGFSKQALARDYGGHDRALGFMRNPAFFADAEKGLGNGGECV